MKKNEDESAREGWRGRNDDGKRIGRRKERGGKRGWSRRGRGSEGESCM